MARGAKIAASIGVGIGAFLLIALIGVMIISQTRWGHERVRGIVLERLDAATDGEIRVGRIEGNLLRRIHLIDVSITDLEGRPFVVADSISTGYSLLSLLRTRIVLRNPRMVNGHLTLDQPPNEGWNYARIFRIDPEPTPEPTIRTGWGDYVVLRDLELVGARVTVRSQWQPEDDLSPAHRERAIDAALAGETRANVQRVADGFQNIMDLRDLQARLPRVRVAHPEDAGIAFEVGALSGVLQPFLPPEAVVHDLTGRFTLLSDSLHFEDVAAVLPASRIDASGVYDLETGRYLLNLRAAPVALADLRWLYPQLPEEGGGSLRLALEAREFTVAIAAQELDLHVGESGLSGRISLVVGDTLRFGVTDLGLDRFDTRLFEQLAPDFDLPIDGQLTGRVALQGPPEAMDVDADVAFADRVGGISRITADGRIGMDEELRVQDLYLRLAPLQTDLVRGAIPQVGIPAGGRLVGEVRLDGQPTGSLRVAGDLTLRDPATGTSRIFADGGVSLADEFRFQAMQLRFAPVHLDLVRDRLPDLPAGVVVTGPVLLDGSPATMLAVRTELELLDRRTGLSRIATNGGIRVGDAVLFRDLNIRFDPLQVAFARTLMPDLPIGGSIAGSATLDGTPGSHLVVRGDLVHQDRGDRSHLAGRAEIAASERIDLDVQLMPLSLAMVGRFAPQAELHGAVNGTLRASGHRSDLAFRADLRVADGGGLMANGRLDLESDQPGYSLDTRLLNFDLAALTRRAPAATSLTGTIQANGRGADPATLRAEARADLSGPRVDGLEADTVRFRLAIADGLAQVDSSLVQLSTAEAWAEGSFGLAEGRHGELAYRIQIDSLHWLAPHAAGADTAVVEALVADPPDTLRIGSVRGDSLAGSLYAAGTVAGNLAQFDLFGEMETENLYFQGNRIGSGKAQHTLRSLGTEQPIFEVDARLEQVQAQSFAIERAEFQIEHQGMRYGSGRARVAAYQDDDTEYRADAEFLLSLERNELRLSHLALRFDTINWSSAQPAMVSWDEQRVEVSALDLRSDTGGRIFLDGILPAEGVADLRLEVSELPLDNVISLLQDDAPATGTVSVEAHVQGTLASPVVAGEAALLRATHEGRELPDTRLTFAYADAELTIDADLSHDGQTVGRAEGRLPIDLAMADREGPRLLDGPLSLELHADSIMLEALPSFTDQLADVRGHVQGDVSVTGTFSDPVLDGTVRLDLASLRVVASGVRYDRIGGTFQLAGQTITVDSLVAWNGGPVQITGGLDVATLAEPVLDLQLSARQALVLDSEDGRLWVDAELEIRGPSDGIEITGEVHTHRGVFYIPESRGAHVVDLEAPETAGRLDPALAAERETLIQPSPLMENLRVEIQLFVAPETWVRSTEANVEVHTDPEIGPLTIRYGGANGERAIEGTITTDRGEYSFMGRRFQITRGVATFLDGGEFEPLIQLAAEHEVQMAGREPLRIRIVIGGTALEPTIALESNAQPPLPQTDLLSFLAFGRTAASLTQQQGSSLSGQGGASGGLVGNVAGLASQHLSAVAANTLLNEFESDAARALGLDVLHITPADLPAELFTGRFEDLLRGTVIEAGTYIGPRLFAAGQARPTMETRPGARLEYRAPSGYRLITSWEPRYLTAVPTLTDFEPDRTSVFGAFLRREWRF